MLSILLALYLPRAAALDLGQKLLWEHRYREAAAVYRDLLSRAPDDADARKGLATAEYWSGDFRGALRDYETVLRLRPGDADARKAVADIRVASAPVVVAEAAAVRDDQPLRRAVASASYTQFIDPLTKWTATAGAYALSAGSRASAPFAAVAVDTVLPDWRLRPAAALRLFRFPDGATKILGSAGIARDAFSATIDRHELLYTASSLQSHPYETTATLAWKHGDDAAVALHAVRYFDGNRGRAAEGYRLVRVAPWLSAGASAAVRDTDESRFDGIRYDPYWTPQHLADARGVVAAKAGIVNLHLDGGWGRESSRTYHPWRASVEAALPLRGALTVTVGVERQTTAFYRADAVRIGFAGRR
ncbi:MAG TPA: tetratricopeptide repeat protein [Thermoanaerobaculia bacterium]